MFAGITAGEECVGQRCEMFHGLGAVAKQPALAGQPRKDADDVAVHDGGRFTKGYARDGRGGVGSDAGQFLPLGRCAWRRGLCGDSLRKFVEVAGAGVVAEAFPKFHHL